MREKPTTIHDHDSADALTQAKKIALRALARQTLSKAQIEVRLKRRGFTNEIINGVVEYLKRLSYIDDTAYANSRARSLINGGRCSPRMALQKLRMQGIEKEQAAKAVEDACYGLDEEELAKNCLSRRRPPINEKSLLPDRLRAARWLMAKEFSESVVRSLLNL